MEQNDAQFILEALHEAAHGGLGHVLCLGGPGKALGLDDETKRFQSMVFHPSVPILPNGPL
jgi:hypothetical protein